MICLCIIFGLVGILIFVSEMLFDVGFISFKNVFMVVDLFVLLLLSSVSILFLCIWKDMFLRIFLDWMLMDKFVVWIIMLDMIV